MLELGSRHAFIGTVRCDSCRLIFSVQKTALSLVIYSLTAIGWQADVRRQVCPRCVSAAHAAA